MSDSKNFTQAYAIVIETTSGRRYFRSFGKSKRIQTAWTLVGAKLFHVDIPRNSLEVHEVAEYLKSKKKKFEIVTVTAEVA